MGHITKKILNNVDHDPLFTRLGIEDNADKKVHFHLLNMRLDMSREAYNTLREGIKVAFDTLDAQDKFD